MKYLWKIIWFIQAFIVRLIPMLLFFVAHTIGEVYIYNWDPLTVLEIKPLPELFDSYLFLYGALGLIILILFFMKLPIIARVMTVGILASQVVFFLKRWEIYIYDLKDVDPYYNFYMGILLSIIAGFVLQVTWRMIRNGITQVYYWFMMKSFGKDKKASFKKIPVKKLPEKKNSK